eukprot:2158493-Alexandrium_andersonii.AAC.1
MLHGLDHSRPAPNVYRQTHTRRCKRLQQFAGVCCAASPGGATRSPRTPPKKRLRRAPEALSGV